LRGRRLAVDNVPFRQLIELWLESSTLRKLRSPRGTQFAKPIVFED
jgi:hypothetical protein